MSWISFGGAAQNPNYTYEPVGYVANDGSGKVITAGSGTAKGGYEELSAATADDWSGFVVNFGVASSSSNRYLVDIAIGAAASEVVILPNVYIQPSTLQGYTSFRVPLQVPAGSRVAVRCSSSQNGGTMKVGITGLVANAANPPGFTTATAIVAADTGNVRPSSISVSATTSATTWTELEDVTAAEYGAFLMIASENATPGTSGQGLRMSLATGAAAAETAIGGGELQSNTANPLLARAILPLIETTAAAGVRLSANIQAAVPGTDTYFVGLIGFR